MHFSHAVDAGHFRGGYRGNKIIAFRRYFDRIDIVTKTPRFLFDEENPISRAKYANISEAVLATLPIKKEEDGKILLNVNRLFLSEALHKVSPWSRADDNNVDLVVFILSVILSVKTTSTCHILPYPKQRKKQQWIRWLSKYLTVMC